MTATEIIARCERIERLGAISDRKYVNGVRSRIWTGIGIVADDEPSQNPSTDNADNADNGDSNIKHRVMDNWQDRENAVYGVYNSPERTDEDPFAEDEEYVL